MIKDFIVGDSVVSVDEKVSSVAKHIGAYQALWGGEVKAANLIINIRFALIRCISDFNECFAHHPDTYFLFVNFLGQLLQVCSENKDEMVKVSFRK